MKETILYHPLTKYVIYYPLYFIGKIAFKIFKITPSWSFFAFRRLYCLTKGKINHTISRKISNSIGKYDINNAPNEVIPDFDIHTAIKSIEKYGYYRLPALMDETNIGKLRQLGHTCTCHVESNNQFDGTESVFNMNELKGNRYFATDQSLMSSGEVLDILGSHRLLNLAQEFLGCKPILDLVLMWWLTNYDNNDSSKSAQYFHFDMDRPRFLKVFFYLTDVDEENGPHIYAKSSNNEKPAQLYKSRRFKDAEIETHYQVDHIKGKAGTILLVNTSGFHKGGIVTKDPRLILQLEYSNSLFGATYPNYKVMANSEIFKKAKAIFPRAFQLFTS